MKIDRIQWIKGFAFTFSDSATAGIGSLQADEKWMSSHYRSAGRPLWSGRIESRYNGGHKNGRIKMRFRGGEPLKHRGIPMKYNAVSTFKLYCIDETSKIFKLCQGEVA